MRKIWFSLFEYRKKCLMSYVDLLYINEEDFYYVLINDMSRLVNSQINLDKHKKFICPYCLPACTTQKILDKHHGV